MKREGEQTLLRIHLRSTDRSGWISAIDALVERARERGLAGGTVLRGLYGMDLTGHVLQTGFFSFVEHVPLIVEIVDRPQAIGRFLDDIDAIIPEGIVTLERGHVLLFRDGTEPAAMRRDVPEAGGTALPSPEEFPVMKLSENGQLLRIFIGEADVWQDEPLYRAIVMKARELGLAGATVLRGAMGFGANSRLHTTKLLELSTDLPIVVEIVDSAEKIQSMLPFLDEAVGEGMITIEAVRVLRYLANRDRPRP